MVNTSTYTAGMLKDSVFKALGISSLNGEDTCQAVGAYADTERGFITAVNACMRRVSLSFPRLKKHCRVVFENRMCDLPEDFGSIISVFRRDGEMNLADVRTCGGKLYLCRDVEAGEAKLFYEVKPTVLTSETPADTPLNISDIMADALVYLTAAELCPAEKTELYAKLMYKYNDIVSNSYDADFPTSIRNAFWDDGMRRRLI